MNRSKSSEDSRYGRVRFLECTGLVAAVLISFELATNYRPGRNDRPWREKDWAVWYNAHQLYQRDPDELSELELNHVKQWCRCFPLVENIIEKHRKTGLSSLTDDECKLLLETVERACPNSEDSRLWPIYEACRRRVSSPSEPN